MDSSMINNPADSCAADLSKTSASKAVAIFASGNGSNAENIIRYFQSNPEKGKVALVVTNRRNAGVIERAERLGVECLFLTRDQISDASILLPILKERDVKMVVLAGFLLMIPDFLIEAFPNGVINIHPALLPKFGGKGMYGANVHKAVVEAGETESGITIHYVSSEYDKGEHLFSASVDLIPEDTPETVEAKIHELERHFFPAVVAHVLASL